MSRIHKKNCEGFTLVEMLVALFIFSMIIVAVSLFAVYYFRNSSFSIEQTQQISKVQSAHTRMIKEIREARIGDDGSWPLLICNDNDITFYADATNDGRADKIRYFLDGATLKRGLIEPTVVPVSYPADTEKVIIIAENVVSGIEPIFEYYNGDWPDDTVNNPLISAERIRNTKHIKVNLSISLTDDFAADPFVLKSGVTIRSLKTNL